MRQFFSIILIAVVFTFFNSSRAQAASQAECAIWICMPGGFPSGCSAAYKAFRYRLKHHMSPLPSLSSCTTGPDGVGTDGRYKLGYEAYEDCKKGYSLKQTGDHNHAYMCFPSDCQPETELCTGYAATPRSQPNYIKIWVKGEYLGQYWY